MPESPDHVDKKKTSKASEPRLLHHPRCYLQIDVQKQLYNKHGNFTNADVLVLTKKKETDESSSDNCGRHSS
jgi:hypothetical protein